MSKFVSIPTSVLADRLGVGMHRLKFEVQQEGTKKGSLVIFHCFIDGKDLTPAQEVIFKEFIQEFTGQDIVLLTRGTA